MQRFGVTAFVAGLWIAQAAAQSTSVPLRAATTYSPTAAWTPGPTCSAGSTAASAQGGYGGGIYNGDGFGTYWVRFLKLLRHELS